MMLFKRSRKQFPNNPRAGATAVEFALVFPIVIVLLLSLIEIMSLYRVTDAMDLAAFDGGREALITTASANDIADQTRASLSRIGVDNATVTVTPPIVDRDTSEIQIEITVPLVPGNGFWFGRLSSGSLDKTIAVQRL